MWPVPRLEVQASNGRKPHRAVRLCTAAEAGRLWGRGCGSLPRPQGWGVSRRRFSPRWSASHGPRRGSLGCEGGLGGLGGLHSADTPPGDAHEAGHRPHSERQGAMPCAPTCVHACVGVPACLSVYLCAHACACVSAQCVCLCVCVCG